MGIATISAASTERQQAFLPGLLRAVSTPEKKNAREISLRAQLCDDLNMRQGGQLCQRSFPFVCLRMRENESLTGSHTRARLQLDRQINVHP